MAWALRASILIAVDAHDGTWCTAQWLAGRVIAPQRVIEPVCDALVSEGLMQAAVIDGVPCYGVHVQPCLSAQEAAP